MQEGGGAADTSTAGLRRRIFQDKGLQEEAVHLAPERAKHLNFGAQQLDSRL